MVFVGGPRQVGKTTLCKDIVGNTFTKFAYYNWDYRKDRRDILDSAWPGDAELLIFDEIHKYRKWKRLIKGEYDQLRDRYRFLVTGSARLDLYRRGSDSLQGRYHYYRLHPFSLGEISGGLRDLNARNALDFPTAERHDYLRTLLTYGGFPEPLLKQNERHLRRWRNERVERLFREDIRDLELIRDMGSMKLLSDILPRKVASLFSLNSIREDLEVSFRAIAHWIDVLEAFYYAYRIYPFAARPIRSLKKEPKLYLWDWSEVEAQAARFENLIASHLLKTVHYLKDNQGYKSDLFYLRDVQKREVDFLETIDHRPWFAVEAKLTDERISPALLYFKERLSIPYTYQVTFQDKIDRMEKGCRIISAAKFLGALF
jgi:predicted AAA+ superfamily ATPase